MNTPTVEKLHRIHLQTREIGKKLKDDATLRAQYLADPIASLTRWGLPLDASQELAAKIDAVKEEVSGYAYDSDGVYYHDLLDDYGIHINWGL